MTQTIAVLAGDGIGPEIMAPAVRLLRTLIDKGLDARLEEAPVGATAWHLCGDPLPAETLALARRADAVLFGAVGDSRLDHLGPKRPDAAIGGLRQGLGLINSLRHISIPPELAGLSPLRPERVAGTDVLIVRELGGDGYFGRDVATVLSGSIGLSGSAMFSEAGKGFYEPGHGSAWDIAGQDRANPIGQLRCVALMLRHSLGRCDLAQVVDDAIVDVLRSGLRTADILPQVQSAQPAHQDDFRLAGTGEMGAAVVAAVARTPA